MGADIFVSYAREDEGRIRQLVSALEQCGWSVFWDHRIPAGQSWRSHIGKALDEARCVIVAWSRAAVASEFVVEEAARARQRGVLVPVRLDPVDPPLGFGELNAADLCGWQAGTASATFEQLRGDLAAVLARTPAAALPAAHSAPSPAPAPALASGDPVEPPVQPPRPSRAWMYPTIAVAAIAIAAVALVARRTTSPSSIVDAGPAPPQLVKTAGREVVAAVPLRVMARATPSSVASGQRTLIVVTVADAAGAPVPGANVIVSSGGGKFLRAGEQFVSTDRLQGPYSASGPTDPAGRYTTAWVCNPCAPEYGMSVTAEKPGFIASSSELTVPVRP